jgi:hypothetical protein
VTVTAGDILIDGGQIASVPSSTLWRHGRLVGEPGTITVTADTIEILNGGRISGETWEPIAAAKLQVNADHAIIVDGGIITTNSETSRYEYPTYSPDNFLAGAAGDVNIRTPRLVVKNGGWIGSSSAGIKYDDQGNAHPIVIPGIKPAGNVRLEVGTLLIEDASIRTKGTGAEGGHIDVTADLIHLQNAEVTSNGTQSAAGSSVITLRAPLIAVDGSQVTALTGTGERLTTSGLVRLFGDATLISADSFVAGSSGVSVSGLENDVGSQLVVPASVFLNVGDLLRESCAARRSGVASNFTAVGRGGLPTDPGGLLAGSYREPSGTTMAGQTVPVLAASFGEGCRAAPGG